MFRSPHTNKSSSDHWGPKLETDLKVSSTGLPTPGIRHSTKNRVEKGVDKGKIQPLLSLFRLFCNSVLDFLDLGPQGRELMFNSVSNFRLEGPEELRLCGNRRSARRVSKAPSAMPPYQAVWVSGCLNMKRLGGMPLHLLFKLEVRYPPRKRGISAVSTGHHRRVRKTNANSRCDTCATSAPGPAQLGAI